MKRATVSKAEPLAPKANEAHAHAPRALPRISEHALEAAAGFFRAAGDVERLRLLAHLRDGERCVGELADAMDEGMSTISQRLKVLRGEGLVRRRRDGKHVRYALADGHVADLLGAALAHAGELRALRTPMDEKDERDEKEEP